MGGLVIPRQLFGLLRHSPWLHDPRAILLKECKAKIGSDINPKSIAQMMTRKRWEATRGGDFNRRILYPKSGWS